MDNKMWYTSRTLWVNILAIGAMIGGGVSGMDIPPEAAVSGLAIINMILRKVTKTKVDWKKPS